LEGVELETKVIGNFLATLPEPGTFMELPEAGSSALAAAPKVKVDLEGAEGSALCPKEKDFVAVALPNDDPPKLED